MHEAARKKNNVKILSTLISMGGNINAQNRWGWTPLHEAILQKNISNVIILLRC